MMQLFSGQRDELGLCYAGFESRGCRDVHLPGCSQPPDALYLLAHLDLALVRMLKTLFRSQK
jgi:hypothetical protein